MNFSICLWLLSFAPDFLLKAGLFFLLSAFALGAAPVSLFMSFALGFSMFHFFSLLVARGFVALFDVACAAKSALTLIIAEILFAAGVSLQCVYIFSQDVINVLEIYDPVLGLTSPRNT
jgi:hypothetical protein